MLRNLLSLFLIGVALLSASVARAQQPDSPDQVKALLTGKGYSVVEVANYPDESGSPRTDTVYAMMEASNLDLDSDDMAQQVTWGMVALHKYYPRVENLLVLMKSSKYLVYFSSTASMLDQYLKKQIGGDVYWNGVRSRVKIYDTERKTYVGEKDFTSGTQNNDQTNKDFTGGTSTNSLPGFVSANAAGENLVLEASTAYLPADGATSLVLIGTLRDKGFLPLANRGIAFSFEPQGVEPTDLGTQTTDASGSARASITSKRVHGSVLFRATTTSLNSQLSIQVGSPVSSVSERIRAVIDALGAQGYAEVDADYITRTSPTGEKTNNATVVMRMASPSFDRSVYSQMARGLGTLRTVFPSANRLVLGLGTRAQGRDLTLWWSAQVAYWDSYIAGKLGESDFWRYLEYLGAEDSKGNDVGVGDKNFIDKNFGAGGSTREARVKRTLDSGLSRQVWGEQFGGQEFVIVPGGYADSFVIADSSGGATGFQIFQAPEFRTPVLTFKTDNPGKLSQVRLGQGQYYFAVLAPLGSAPAGIKVTYVEHLPQ